MKKFLLLTGIIASGLSAAPVSAGILDVSATLSSTPDAGHFDYAITVTNSAASTDSLETFWFAWMPGKDFLPTAPLSVTPPAGWTDIVTNMGAGDGFAIQFKTSTDPLAPGKSLGFAFTSNDSPAMIAGNSPFFPGTPVETSTVYEGQPFSGDSARFSVTSVPEPSSLALGAFGLLAACGGRRLRRRR